MKVTVDFFNLKNKSINNIKFLEYFKYLILFVNIILVITVLGINLIKIRYINENIINMACNIRQAENTKISKRDIIFIASSFNSSLITSKTNDNYKEKVNLIKSSKKGKNNVEKEDKSDNKLKKFDVSVIDTIETISKKDKDNLSIKDNDNNQIINVYGMTISNYSSKRDIDILSLFNKNIILSKKESKVLIYSTHTSESYTNSERYKFNYTSTYRTQDAKYNMLSVDNILSTALKEKNIQTIFDTTPHDYGNYEIAYTNSRKTIQNAIDSNENIDLAIDVHRDALGDLTKATTVEIKGQKVARLMFVMGVGTTSYSNENWEKNLALALQLQKLGEEMYPGLFRGMIIRNSRYNQDLVKNSFLVEVGTTGNTLEEAYFGARCLANILNKFYNN